MSKGNLAIRLKAILLILLFSAGLIPNAMAITVPMNFTVNVLVPPPCVINNDQTITVDFGEIPNREIDHRHAKNLIFGLNCSSAVQNELRIRLTGKSALFDASVLATDKDNLGIAIYNDGQSLVLGEWINFVYPTLPTLTVQAVGKTGVQITPGYFTANATLIIDYQ